MAGPLRILPSQARDLGIVAEISPALLEQVAEELSHLSATVIEASTIRQKIQSILGNAEQATALSGQVLTLANFAQFHGQGPGEVVEGLELGIKALEKWPEDKLAKFAKLKGSLSKLLAADSITVAAKALELSYEHEHLFDNVKIITDVRPVFDNEKTKILGGIVIQTMTIHFSAQDSASNFSSITIGLEAADIRALQQACGDALRKAEAAKELIKQRCGIPVFSSGEQSYGSD